MRRFLSRFNLLAVLSGCLMVASMLLPWWSLVIGWSRETDVYPHIISGPASEMIGYRRSPQMTMLTYALVLCIVLCFVGSVLRGWKARITLGAAGILPVLVAWRFIVRIAGVAERFGMPIQGRGIASYGGFSPMETSARLRPGLYLIVVAGILCLVSSILYDKFRLRLE